MSEYTRYLPFLRARLAEWEALKNQPRDNGQPAYSLRIDDTGAVWDSDQTIRTAEHLRVILNTCEPALDRTTNHRDRAWAELIISNLLIIWGDHPDYPPPRPRLHVVPHDVEDCVYCKNPKVRAVVLAEDQGDEGWMCSKCGWATVDLGTMHRQLWPYVNRVHDQAIDMVCPDCGVQGAFVDYSPKETVDA